MTDTYETKGTGDLATAIDDLARAFEVYKETNDRELAEIKSHGAADVLTREKIARIDRQLDDLALKARRPQLATGAARATVDLAHKSAFDAYVRKGESAGLADLEAKALSAGTGADGGYLVPDETERTVNMALRDISPIRAIAAVRQVSGSVFKKPFSVTGPGTGWVGETAARPETTSPTLAELAFPTMELYAMPAATPSLLDDAAVNIDEWIAEEVRVAFAEQEGAAFVTGDGVNKPKGFLNYPKVAAGSWTWGNLGFIVTGAAGAFPASNPTDKLIDLAYSVKSGYRANAHFVMSRATQAAIRKFKDADGNYIWQPAGRPGEAPTLLGHPVAESEDMPAIAADSYSIAFGDFRRGYLVVDRVGIRILRDPYSSKPYVLFYTTKRVGGGIQDFNAIKLLKFAV
ncbi:MAG: phage major capsid protein [Hyphomicrobiaceae bacterium]|nr:phage major capsid protein [Hyphomicrobiaceae bacterium]